MSEFLVWYSGFWPWSKSRCKARLKRGEDPKYHGRCDLVDHEEWDCDHALDRGLIRVRWHQGLSGRNNIWYQQIIKR